MSLLKEIMKYLITSICFIFAINSSFGQCAEKYELLVYAGKKNGTKQYLLYESLQLNSDNTFIWKSEYDLAWSLCGTFQKQNNFLELTSYLSKNIYDCETQINFSDSVQNKMKKYEFKKYKFLKNELFIINKNGTKKKRIKDNSIRRNIFTYFFGHKFILLKTDCN
jgi:hypothetical protein